MAGQLNLDF
jgi:hypothetical protein